MSCGGRFGRSFLNRIDDIIVFNQLGREHLREIFGLQLVRLRRLLADKGIEIEVADSARELVLHDGYQEEFGARPMRRAIQRLIQDPLALRLLDGEFGEGDVVLVEADPAKTEMRFAKRQEVAA